MAILACLAAVLFGVMGCAQKPSRVYRVAAPALPGASVTGPEEAAQGPNNTAGRIVAGLGRVFMGEAAAGQRNGPPIYHVGPGDVLEVRIFQLQDVNRDTIEVVTVDQDGRILLPMLNYVPVEGMTCTQVRQELVRRLSQSFLREPRVTVRVRQYFNKQVMVLGSVGQVGPVALESDAALLLEVIGRARGIRHDHSGMVEIIRGGYERFGHSQATQAALTSTIPAVPEAGDFEVVRIPVVRVLGQGGRQVNPLVYPGDLVYVPPARDGRIFVSGEVKTPGAKIFRRPLNILQAVITAGGATKVAAEDRCQLIRLTSEGQEQIFKIDLKKVRQGKAENLWLARNDTIIIPTDPIKKFFDDIDRLIRRGIDMGVSVTYSASAETTGTTAQ